MLDRSSHFSNLPSGRALVRGGNPRNLPQIYLPAEKGRLSEIYLREAGGRRLISSLKWFISTCIVGAAGLCIIGVAMYASTDMNGRGGIVESLRRAGLDALRPKESGNVVEDRAGSGEKTDKIKLTTKGTTTKHIIQDSIVERRNSREFIKVKPYARIVAMLSTAKPDETDAIPPFNPLDLYTDTGPETAKAPDQKQLSGAPLLEHVSLRQLDMAGGFLPEEDNQELTDVEVERYVAEADAFYAESAAQMRPAIIPGSGEDGEVAEDADAANSGQAVASAEKVKAQPRTTIIEKLVDDEDSGDETVVESAIAKSGDTVVTVLKNAGVESWQAQSISDALTSAGLKLRAGQEVRMQLAAAGGDGEKEPLKVSVFSGVKAEASVERAMDGEYGVSDEPVEVAHFKDGDEDDDNGERATLYTAIYSAALSQGLEPDMIHKLLRILTYDVDFKQKVRPGDSFELFFDVKQDDAGSEKAGELLYAAMNIAGVSTRYYRFRTPDGMVDFYNDHGSNSRKFLMQMPIKAGRFTSGFGFRRHPLLGIRKMHTGIDWAAPIGTPILSAGDGTIEIAERHGGNGNYVRIRHGNGYKTAYSHQSRFAPGVKPGVKVRQGQVIGFVGTTGLSTGPHLHYEVLVNNRFTNPLKVRVPRSRQLNGRLLAEFKKEESRVDELMHRAPVKTRIAAAHE